MTHIVYLTGAPAAGKSTAARLLATYDRSLQVFEFGERLTAHLSTKASGIAQADLRRDSAAVVTPEDVVEVERQLFDLAERCRGRSHLVIDSHPVTKESYGFRITPYSLADLGRLAPTQIWVLYASAQATLGRIRADPQGRPLVTPEEATMHTHLQASVAASYGVAVGLPVHLFDTSALPAVEVARMLAGRLGIGGA